MGLLHGVSGLELIICRLAEREKEVACVLCCHLLILLWSCDLIQFIDTIIMVGVTIKHNLIFGNKMKGIFCKTLSLKKDIFPVYHRLFIFSRNYKKWVRVDVT